MPHLMTDQAPELLREALNRIIFFPFVKLSDFSAVRAIAKEALALTRPPSERPVAQMREALIAAQVALSDGGVIGPLADDALNKIAVALYALTAERPEAAVAWAARTIFDELCPGIRWDERDRPAYESAARKILYAIQHEEPGRETMTSVAGDRIIGELPSEQVWSWLPIEHRPLKTGHYIVAHRGYEEILHFSGPDKHWAPGTIMGWRRLCKRGWERDDPVARFRATHCVLIQPPPP